MTITEVRVTLAGPDEPNDRIRGYATIVLNDALAIRDLRIIEVRTGRHHIQFPNRPIRQRCTKCGRNGPITNRYCGRCGAHRPHVPYDPSDVYTDLCFPIRVGLRKQIEGAVLGAYCQELRQQARSVAEQHEAAAPVACLA